MTADARQDAATESERLSLRLWLHLMKATKTIEANVGSRLRRVHNQSLARFDVLSQLGRFGNEWATVGEVAARVMASSGNITALLDRMAAEDLIVRRASPDDRRSHQVRMTDKGRALFEDMIDDHARWIGAALDSIDDRDKERLIALLVEVRRAFEASPGAGDTAGDPREEPR